MEAIREMVYSDSEKLSIKIPKEFIRKRLEVLVFPIMDNPIASPSGDRKFQFNAVRIETKGFKFDRDELHER